MTALDLLAPFLTITFTETKAPAPKDECWGAVVSQKLGTMRMSIDKEMFKQFTVYLYPCYEMTCGYQKTWIFIHTGSDECLFYIAKRMVLPKSNGQKKK